MGERGPAPMPTALRVLTGNASEHALPAAEPQPEVLSAADARPSEELPPAALEIFKTKAEILARTRVLTEQDVATLTRYADLYARWQRAKQVLDEEGMTYEVRKLKMVDSPDGGKMFQEFVSGYKSRPEVEIYLKLHPMILKIEIQFGMTPASRTRVQAIGVEKSNAKKSKHKLYG